MKIAIISDTHDNLATLDKFISFAKIAEVGTVIHCGDVADGPTLEHLVQNLNVPVFLALGNMDYVDRLETIIKKYPNRITLFENFGKAELCGLNIGFCHHIQTARDNAKKGNFDFVFYGHSHKPWMENIGSCVMANPGNLAGMFYKATFATLDAKTKKLDLHIVERI